MLSNKQLVFKLVLIFTFVVQAQSLKFIPIEHASFIIVSKNTTIFVDPVGDIDNYKGYTPDLILITHTHLDHLNEALLKSVKTDKTLLFAPKSVIEKTGYGKIIKNGESIDTRGIQLEAIAMYNTTEGRLKYHPKGDGNGYILTVDSKRVYIAGDTEDIPEMRNLKNIDHAFICMNLPYTMTIQQAISATLEFKPKTVYPYHYRGKNGKSDVAKFKTEIENNSNINVEILKWY